MKKILLLLSLAFTISSSSSMANSPQDELPPSLNLDELRSQLLRTAESSRFQEFVVSPSATPNSVQDKLLKYYRDHIMPVLERFEDMGSKYSALNQLIEAGLYRSPEENLEWEEKFKAVLAEYTKLETDANWQKVQLEFGRLAAGLDGNFAALARRMAEKVEISAFPPEMSRLYEEAEELSHEISKVAKESPKLKDMQKLQPESSKLVMAFHSGEVSLSEASKRLEEIRQQGSLAFGQDVAETAREKLNRRAIVLTQLAKSKGQKNWADYQLADQAREHASGLGEKANLVRFLEGILSETDQVVREFREVRAQRLAGRNYQSLSEGERTFISEPAFLLLRSYFPKEDIVSIWKETMLESGFEPILLNSITVDAYPRASKQTHAYMRPIQMRRLQTLTVDGQTLQTHVPDFKSPEWHHSHTHIHQKLTDDGLGNLSTMFHEGGHGLDFSYQMNEIDYPQAYGLAETHSTTMESFTEDVEFLLARGKTRTGEALPKEVLETYLSRRAYGDLAGLRYNVTSALYDIDLWDYEYTENSMSFVDRALMLTEKWNTREAGVASSRTEGIREGYSHFVTGHFYSGSVRYFGYVLAEVAATIVTQRTLDLLETQTGRRSLYKQPALAGILTEGLYKRGFVELFPIGIEQFAQKKFAPEAFTGELIAKLKAYTEKLKQPQKGPKKKGSSCLK